MIEALGMPEAERLIIATPLSYPAQGSYDEAASISKVKWARRATRR